jgi:hypothetical protein
MTVVADRGEAWPIITKIRSAALQLALAAAISASWPLGVGSDYASFSALRRSIASEKIQD